MNQKMSKALSNESCYLLYQLLENYFHYKIVYLSQKLKKTNDLRTSFFKDIIPDITRGINALNLIINPNPKKERLPSFPKDVEEDNIPFESFFNFENKG